MADHVILREPNAVVEVVPTWAGISFRACIESDRPSVGIGMTDRDGTVMCGMLIRSWDQIHTCVAALRAKAQEAFGPDPRDN